MDYETLYTAVGVVGFGVIAFFTFRNKESSRVQTKDEKKYEILSGYKKEMREKLSSLENQDEKSKLKKELLMKYNQELALNIFFDEIDAKDMLNELASFDI